MDHAHGRGNNALTYVDLEISWLSMHRQLKAEKREFYHTINILKDK